MNSASCPLFAPYLLSVLQHQQSCRHNSRHRRSPSRPPSQFNQPHPLHFLISPLIYICALLAACIVHRIFCVVSADHAIRIDIVALSVPLVLAILKVRSVYFILAVRKGQDVCIELEINSVCGIYAVSAVCVVRPSYDIVVVYVTLTIEW